MRKSYTKPHESATYKMERKCGGMSKKLLHGIEKASCPSKVMVRKQWKSLVFFIVLVIYSSYICGCTSSVAVCITNCVQCKQMFGQYFQGRACGDACMATGGLITPDCNNPISVRSFLKRLY